MAPTPILDHIVLLLPHETLVNLPSWLTDSFTVLEGGRHAGGVTENKLILFQDGVYLELIAFVPGKDEGRESHNWGHRREGHIVDWANTLHNEDDLETIRSRVGAAKTGIAYSSPTPGGRIKPDGTELKWIISSPKLSNKGSFVGGEAPFWCLDRTPRNLRVPYHVESNVKHASGAVGVQQLTVFVKNKELFQALKRTYDALQGQEGLRIGETEDTVKFSWPLRTLEPVLGDNTPGTLVLVQSEPEGLPQSSGDVSVSLTLVSSTKNGSVAGNLGDDNWKIRFELKKREH
ncbi:hypothetical protein VP1G_02959 [Cytospora mali]|uniref:Glyoxalase-like domain-containing protein n=1 Tax=Cytospora mali TaxID=578113 RepID=A0A194UV91_CYTMA|nr:hypothetical protein VP1G_02959 [Valsa mali var. pyri (nom. inval.)]